MKRLIEKTVFCGFVTAWRLATVPTRRSPPCVNATTDGVVRPPSAFSMTVGSPPSSTAMHELVVPRSIPIVFAISLFYSYRITKSECERSRFFALGHADGASAVATSRGVGRRDITSRASPGAAPRLRLRRRSGHAIAGGVTPLGLVVVVVAAEVLVD